MQSNSMKLTMYVLITKQPNIHHYTEHSQSQRSVTKKIIKKTNKQTQLTCQTETESISSAGMLASKY